MLIIASINLLHFIYFQNLKQPDDYTISLAARQMLRAQTMLSSALAVAQGSDEDRGILQEKIEEYDSVLQTFTNGGMLDGRKPSPPTEEIRHYITVNNQLWQEYKQKAVLIANSGYNDPGFQDALKYMGQKTPELVAVNERIVQGYTNLGDFKWQLAGQMTLFFTGINAIIFGLAFLYTRKFISPIKELKTAVDSARKGEHVARAKVMSEDEVGSLAASFNYMLDVIKERTKELELKSKVIERINVHMNELVKKENEANERLQSLTIQLRQQVEKLREVDIAKEEFSSMVTHELKTPLVPILLYCELFLDGKLGNLTQKQKEKVKVMYESARSLSELIQDVLDIHRLELGKMKFEMHETSTKELIDKCVNRFKPLAQAKNVRLISNADAPIIIVQCDPERILQVINNLVSNALKFLPENDGKVVISVTKHDNTVVFCVKDNGIGIPKDKQPNLFKKFYQVDMSNTRKSGGTGLGLAICKGIIEMHNGNIWCESEEGKGTAFYFSIPIVSNITVTTKSEVTEK